MNGYSAPRHRHHHAAAWITAAILTPVALTAAGLALLVLGRTT